MLHVLDDNSSPSSKGGKEKEVSDDEGASPTNKDDEPNVGSASKDNARRKSSSGDLCTLTKKTQRRKSLSPREVGPSEKTIDKGKGPKAAP